MKYLTIFLIASIAAIVLSSFAYAEESVKDIDLSKSANMSLSDKLNFSDKLNLILTIIKSGNADKIEGQKLEGILGKIFKNEIVNIHVDIPEEDVDIFIKTAGGTIKDIGLGENNKPTMNVDINKAKLEKIIQESENSKEIIKSALKQKAVKIQGIGVTKRVKLWFLIKIGKITGVI